MPYLMKQRSVNLSLLTMHPRYRAILGWGKFLKYPLNRRFLSSVKLWVPL